MQRPLLFVSLIARYSLSDDGDLTDIGGWDRGVGIVTIYNGFCRFNPSTPRGRYIFVSQTLVLSFTPLIILLIQNSFRFNDMMLQGERNLEKSKLVNRQLFLLDIPCNGSQKQPAFEGIFGGLNGNVGQEKYFFPSNSCPFSLSNLQNDPHHEMSTAGH